MTPDATSAHPPAGEAHWFCLRSQPRHEHIAAAHLRNLENVEVFLPRIRFQRATKQGKAWVTEALFPGYLFAHFEWQPNLRRVQAARGVSCVVHFGDRWPTIAPVLIEELRQLVGSSEPLFVPAQLAVGDEVKILSGAFGGMAAVVSQVMPGRQRVEVLMDFLGRQTRIQVSEDGVIKPGFERAKLR